MHINFAENPPRIDFAIVKLHGGTNLVDMTTGKVFSVGSGELAQSITNIGNALRATIEATLKNMQPGESIRGQILLHGNAQLGYELGLAGSFAPGFGQQLGFVMGGNDKSAPVHIVQMKDKIKPGTGNAFQEGKVTIVPVAVDGIRVGEGFVQHPTTDNQSGAEIVELDGNNQ